ncbi:MAG TPA: 6-hydroxymethylpterin diphosphokinase MptE-like protein [Anaerolineales bacterium]|nr:6-hydroxymethylpterin diphosphokinase MptE-like protein [Anaerolineales bacterium]
MKQTIKQVIPQPIWQFTRDTYDAFRRIPELPAAYFHPWRRESIKRLAELKDIHKGKRAFVIGNGPSLNQTDLSKLEHEITFGMNRIYIAFSEWGFTTTYLCVTNDLVVGQFADDFIALPIPKFIAWRSHRHFNPELPMTQLPTFVYTSYTGPRFTGDVRGRVWEGATVTNLALQLAFHMGIEKAILIGVDHNFASKGDANKTVVSDGDDPNHFMPTYFGKGVKWQLPDLDTSEIGYALARDTYRRAGREVVDATVDGKLTIFSKVEYNSLF